MTENNFTTERKDTNNFPKIYIQFRTVLDALEINTLRYCLEEKDESVRIERTEKIIELLMPIVEKYQTKTEMSESDCAVGLFECNGCCVPYPCP